MTRWYVVGKEPAEGDYYVSVFGPFTSETDARAFALDEANDNGWDSIEPVQLTFEQANQIATDNVLWPYESEEREDEE